MAQLSVDDGGVIVSCRQCGKSNRLPFDRVGAAEARCGHCKTPLEAPSAPIAVDTARRFDALVRAPSPVLVDFWAPWCGPCRVVGPIIEELAHEYAGSVKVGKLNVDDNLQTAQMFRVMSIPTVILFKDGQPVEQVVGVARKADYQARIAKHLN